MCVCVCVLPIHVVIGSPLKEKRESIRLEPETARTTKAATTVVVVLNMARSIVITNVCTTTNTGQTNTQAIDSLFLSIYIRTNFVLYSSFFFFVFIISTDFWWTFVVPPPHHIVAPWFPFDERLVYSSMYIYYWTVIWVNARISMWAFCVLFSRRKSRLCWSWPARHA